MKKHKRGSFRFGTWTIPDISLIEYGDLAPALQRDVALKNSLWQSFLEDPELALKNPDAIRIPNFICSAFIEIWIAASQGAEIMPYIGWSKKGKQKLVDAVVKTTASKTLVVVQGIKATTLAAYERKIFNSSEHDRMYSERLPHNHFVVFAVVEKGGRESIPDFTTTLKKAAQKDREFKIPSVVFSFGAILAYCMNEGLLEDTHAIAIEEFLEQEQRQIKTPTE